MYDGWMHLRMAPPPLCPEEAVTIRQAKKVFRTLTRQRHSTFCRAVRRWGLHQRYSWRTPR